MALGDLAQYLQGLQTQAIQGVQQGTQPSAPTATTATQQSPWGTGMPVATSTQGTGTTQQAATTAAIPAWNPPWGTWNQTGGQAPVTAGLPAGYATAPTNPFINTGADTAYNNPQQTLAALAPYLNGLAPTQANIMRAAMASGPLAQPLTPDWLRRGSAATDILQNQNQWGQPGFAQDKASQDILSLLTGWREAARNAQYWQMKNPGGIGAMNAQLAMSPIAQAYYASLPPAPAQMQYNPNDPTQRMSNEAYAASQGRTWEPTTIQSLSAGNIFR